MAEALGLVASIIAVVQVSETIIKVCKGYIEGVQDYPSDLRRILLEVSTLKDLFANLEFLSNLDGDGSSPILAGLGGIDGPIEGCHNAITQLQKLLPEELHHGDPCRIRKSSSQIPGTDPSLKPRVCSTKWGQVLRPSLTHLAWPLKKNKALSLLAEMAQYKATITMAFSSELVQDMKVVKGKLKDVIDTLDAASRKDFRLWLWTVKPSSLHNAAAQVYEPGTGEWLFSLCEWNEWLNTEKRCLWIHGIPGAGKTVLFSKLVELTEAHCRGMNDRRVGTAYYYCFHARNHDETTPFLRWVLGQLCVQADSVPSEMHDIYQNGLEPTLEQMLAAIEQMLQCFDVFFLCLDAVDESQPRATLLRVLGVFMTQNRFDKIQVLATSREYVDIEIAMDEISTPISMAHPLVEKDIRRYVSRELSSNRQFRGWALPLKEKVQDVLAAGAQGMFRWAVCQLDLLRRNRLQTAKAIQAALQTLPQTLDETYERIFKTIPEEDKELVRMALLWIEFHNRLPESKGNIPLAFLTRILSRSTADVPSEESTLNASVEWLREVCGCLIRAIESSSNPDPDDTLSFAKCTVSFAHYTVREFLTSSRITGSPVSYFKLDKMSLVQECVPLILRDTPNKIIAEEDKDPTLPYPTRVYPVKPSDRLVEYCLSCAIVFCNHLPYWESELLQDEQARDIVLDFLRSNRVLEIELAYGTRVRANPWMGDYTRSRDSLVKGPFIREHEDSASDTILLFRLICRHAYKLADLFLKQRDLTSIFNHRVEAQVLMKDTYRQVSINGTIFDIDLYFIRQEYYTSESSAYLLRIGAGHFDPSLALVTLIKRFYSPESKLPSPRPDSDFRLLKQLLAQGANPNWNRLPMTALQIASMLVNIKVVQILLDGGADPNIVGQAAVSDFAKDMETRKIRRLTPLQLCRLRLGSTDAENQIATILLGAGAKEVPQEMTMEEELEISDLIDLATGVSPTGSWDYYLGGLISYSRTTRKRKWVNC